MLTEWSETLLVCTSEFHVATVLYILRCNGIDSSGSAVDKKNVYFATETYLFFFIPLALVDTHPPRVENSIESGSCPHV